LTGAAVLIPASEIAVSIANWLVCKVKKPSFFPRLELKDGIPDHLCTMVVIPVLLSDEKRVEQLLENIESHYLANREKNLYFVDSRTADHPIGKKIADLKQVRCYERNVFLDGQKPKEFVKKKLIEAANLALKKGYAVAIGHVGVEGGKTTAQAIIEMLPEFERKNIELVFISELD
jgi:polysaccharide deacetylase 2 family uncharacterized protein YibQ